MENEKIEYLKLEILHPFENNPFQSVDESEYDELRDSVKEFGIITPLIVNKSDNGYEIISGHRRWQIAKELNFDVVPVYVREFSKEEAVINFVDCNLSREKILPSEKARAYKMKHDAIKKQGARTDLTSSQVGTKFRSDEKLAEREIIKTMKEIVDYMNGKGFRTKKGGKTNLNSISRLLQNRHYIGEYHYKDIITPGGIPTIVPVELFDAVQERLKTNKKAPAKHKAEEDYFLTTKIFCSDCNSPMAGECGTSHSSKVYHYYKCSNAKRRKGCKRKAIRKDWIENTVLTYAKNILEDDEYINNLISAIISESKKDNTLLPMLKRELSEVDKRIRNMLDAIQDGIYTASTKQRLEELEARKEDIEVQLAMEELGRTKINEDMLHMWFDKMKKLDTTTLDYKRMFFDAFVNSVYVMDNGIGITLNYLEGTKIITFDEMKKFYNEGSDLSPPARPY